MSSKRVIQDIEILKDRSKERDPDEGFLRLRRLELRNHYADGSTSAAYACDIVSRPNVDAVTVLLYQRVTDKRVLVGLREGLRPPIFLRRYKTDLPYKDETPIDLMLETVAGILEIEDANLDQALGVARRASCECLEEAGLVVPPENILELGAASFPSPGVADEMVYFRAAEVDFNAASEAGGDGSVMEEVGGLVVLELGDALARCRAGTICDMKTEIALARLRDLLLPLGPSR